MAVIPEDKQTVYSNGSWSGSGSETVSFGALYEEHMPAVYRYIFYRVADRSIAEDVTSDIFNKALENFRKFEPEKASFVTWVFVIARNTLTDYYRKRAKEKKTMSLDDVDTPSGSDTPDANLVKTEEVEKLHACLLKLKSNEQELIALKFSSGMTNRDIAVLTGLSESNVGTILCRAIRKLRDDFAGW